jgi:predicted Zn-dependent protease
LLKARLLFQRGDAQASLDWAQKAAASKQGNRRDVHELLARIQKRLGNAEAAAAEIEITERFPVGVLVWDDPEMTYGATFLRDASVLNTLADIARANGEMKRCLAHLRRIVEAEPENFIAREKLAATLVDDGQFGEAEGFLDLSLKEKPDSPDLLYLRGRVHLARKEFDAARKQFERAVQLKPDYDEAWAYLGRACLGTGDHTAAVSALQEAKRLSPTEPDTYRLLAQALGATAQGTAAVDVLRQALLLTPDNDALRQELIEALLANKQRAAAVSELEEAVKKAKNPRPFTELLRTLQGPRESATPETTTDKG